jgi:proteic killer suppression protein
VIKSIHHKGLRQFYETGKTSGNQPKHAKRLRLLLVALESAQSIDDMDVPGFRLHALKGRRKGRWSVWVNGNWRITFEFDGNNANDVDYEDYQ